MEEIYPPMQAYIIKEFVSKLGIDKLLGKAFKTNDPALFRYHTDQKNLRFSLRIPE